MKKHSLVLLVALFQFGCTSTTVVPVPTPKPETTTTISRETRSAIYPMSGSSSTTTTIQQ